MFAAAMLCSDNKSNDRSVFFVLIVVRWIIGKQVAFGKHIDSTASKQSVDISSSNFKVECWYCQRYQYEDAFMCVN